MSRYTESVEAYLNGKQAVSTGECPGCSECADMHDMTPEEHDRAWHEGDLSEHEGSFSWTSCGICGTHLGGDRYVWHYIAGQPSDDLKGREIQHRRDACTDCVLYLANGDEPEQWRKRASDPIEGAE